MSSDVSESNNKRKREINDEENHVDKLIRRTTNINKSALDKTKAKEKNVKVPSPERPKPFPKTKTAATKESASPKRIDEENMGTILAKVASEENSELSKPTGVENTCEPINDQNTEAPLCNAATTKLPDSQPLYVEGAEPLPEVTKQNTVQGSSRKLTKEEELESLSSEQGTPTGTKEGDTEAPMYKEEKETAAQASSKSTIADTAKPSRKVENKESTLESTLKIKKEQDSDSDFDCISQEDLLAQLGLNSVKKLQTIEPDPNRVVEPEPPKQSILDLLKQPCSRKVMPSAAIPDKEKPLTNGSFVEAPADVENLESKERLILRLQNNLRNEEAKLMLLRKLYACQNEKPGKETNPVRTGTVTVAATSQAQSNTTATTQRKPTVAAVSQKQQPQQQQKGQKMVQKMVQKTKAQPPVLVQKQPQPNVAALQPHVVFLSQPRGQQPVIIAPKLVPVSDAKLDNRQVKVQMVSPPTNKPRGQSLPPATVYAHNVTAPTAKRQSIHLDGGRSAENGIPKPVKKMRSPPTPEQSHAEAKMALRKQLEKTLLEIPLPKPPVQDWNFVPSVNTQDFTILVGLEGVVSHIIKSQNDAPKAFIPPKFCSNCDTDFTPGWRMKAKDPNLGTLCESCYTQKIKKTLKTEHTTRLKDAFMKALKQEQEVEKKYQLSGASVSTASVKPQAVRTSSAQQAIHQPRLVYHPVHTIPQPQVYQPHHSIVHQLQQQQLQQQDLDSRQEPARYFTYVGQPQPKQRHNYTTDNDRQREYLLDMIPSGHSSRNYRI